jgi:dihydroflavonol-4-reductase
VSTTLVTGGCGFIGRHLVAELLARGERVRVLDLARAGDLPAEVEFVHGSVLDAESLARAMAQVGHVYHLAGIARLWVPDPSDFERINAGGTERVLQAAAEQRVARVVHCSTEAILLPKHAAAGAAIDESTRPSLADMPGPYTRSKHLAEQAVQAAVQRGVDAVIVNPTVPIGADDRNLTPPAAMLAMFLAGQSPAYLDCMLNLVDVRDVAAGMALAAAHGRTGERYILGGENMALRDLLALLGRQSSRPMPKFAIPGAIALASAAVAEWWADLVSRRAPLATREGVRLALRSAPFVSRKAQAELGYAPRPVENALAEAVRWLSAAVPGAAGQASPISSPNSGIPKP